jgi:hypothetical protein
VEHIRSIEAALASVRVRARPDLTADEMKEIVRASYELDTTHSAEIGGDLGEIEDDCSDEIFVTLDEIKKRIKARYG